MPKPSHDLTAQLLAWLPAALDYVWHQYLAPWLRLLPAWGLYRLATRRRKAA